MLHTKKRTHESSSEEEEEDKNDIVNVLRSRCELNDDNLVFLLKLFIEGMFGKEECISLIDPTFLTLYMKKRFESPEMAKRKRTREDESAITRRLNAMKQYFDYADYDEQYRVVRNFVSHKSITLIPLHHDAHWSLLIYFNDKRQFYHFDSYVKKNAKGDVRHYHYDFAIDVITQLVDDRIITQLHDNTITLLECPVQKDDFECGHYVIMYMCAFFKVLQQENEPIQTNAPPTVRVPAAVLTRLRSMRPYVQMNNMTRFNETLQSFVTCACNEGQRGGFLKTLINHIHNKRGY